MATPLTIDFGCKVIWELCAPRGHQCHWESLPYPDHLTLSSKAQLLVPAPAAVPHAPQVIPGGFLGNSPQMSPLGREV